MTNDAYDYPNALDVTPDTLPLILARPWLMLPPELRTPLLECWLTHKHMKGLQQDCVLMAMQIRWWSRYIHDVADDSRDNVDDHISDVLSEIEHSHYKTTDALLEDLDSLLETLADRLQEPVPAPAQQ